MHIGGKSRFSSDGGECVSEDPYTRRAWSSFPDATANDVDQAVEAAGEALRSQAWRGLSGAARGELLRGLADVLEENAEELAFLESRDVGKPIRENIGQANFAAGVYRYFAGWADKLEGSVIPMSRDGFFDYMVYEPVGVCALLTAFNSPMQLLANKLPAALAAGNTVVIKPSEYNSSSTLRFAELIERVGFPAGVINVVSGRGEVCGKALVVHPDIDMVSLTGGETAGRAIAGEAAPQFKRLVMELGGKSPNIVFADADLSLAAAGVAGGVFVAGGQTCVAGSRLLVEDSIFDEFVGMVVEEARGRVLGDPLDYGTDMGPLANPDQHARVVSYIESGISAGANLVTGWGSPPSDESSLFVPPTVFTLSDREAAIYQDEIFGPVVVAIPFSGEGEAVARANETRFGLAAGVWTQNLGRAHRVASAVEASSVWVNTYRVVSEAAPFGGRKGSGVGRERGLTGLLEFVETKNVMIDIRE